MRKTKIAGAMEALAKVRKEIGDERFKSQAAGSLQCRVGYRFSEATINAARKRLLKGE
jgi:hypothetical protein